jgi:hypothetical protein
MTKYKIVILLYLFSFFNQLMCNSVPLIYSLNKISNTNPNNYKFRKLVEHLSNIRGDSSPIFGNSTYLNYYYVDIYIGEPPQKQSVIIDTGSHITAVPCLPHCKNCGKHLNKYYDMRNSKFSRVLNCEEETCKNFGYGSCNADKDCGFQIVINILIFYILRVM